ncbi:MAG TPA: NAD(+)/NADH kinase [Acidimicrobiales bacterium]|nr:NAD(+)/NADH kinase [Acidimicrobiales bacterium]
MSTVALCRHPDRARAEALSDEVTAWLAARGHATTGDAEGADLLVSVGGDGTMLRAVAQAAPHGTPVLGINVGQLGYLTEVDPSHWQDALLRWEEGRSPVVERMLLSVRLEREGDPDLYEEPDDAPPALDDGHYLALNEAVVEKTPIGRMVRLAVHLDDAVFATYAADGMIVATPTGSTAYALSARGPILDPAHRALVLAPVAPHMVFDRPLVLTPETRVRLVVSGERPATVAIDGRSVGELHVGDALVVTAAATSARLVTSGESNFHEILKAKFGLEDR